MPTILFVCTGNTCRSPMAEALAKAYFADLCLDLTAASCGVFAHEHQEASPNAVAAMKSHGLAICGHRAKGANLTDLAAAHMIITMTVGHKARLLALDEALADKTYTFGELVGNGDVTDPFGGDLKVYLDCAALIKQYIEETDWRKFL